MKVEVTHLKAAWPEGTRIGDVVDLPGDQVPAWAVGKCKPAEEAAAAVAEAASKAPAKGKK